MKILVLLGLVTVAASTPVPFFKSCDSVGQVVSLDVTPCDHSGSIPLCEFPKNHNVTIKVTFRMGAEITAAKPAVYAYLGIIENTKVPAPFRMEQDSCERFSSPCPLAANTDYTYTTVVFVEPSYPSVRTIAEWQIHDQNDQKVFCFDVPVEIV